MSNNKKLTLARLLVIVAVIYIFTNSFPLIVYHYFIHSDACYYWEFILNFPYLLFLDAIGKVIKHPFYSSGDLFRNIPSVFFICGLIFYELITVVIWLLIKGVRNTFVRIIK
ncbi:MAG: hypothetical protein A2452_03665 [Candidatus Firestonebacteria bacterium RIFOXYC2_FULL_39_67]|nr:MAG: hypothetical protein A2536_00490 [Candidatus Firestonebacteria bacterium RIFOXYD2_FULL_39_29]OGF51928.1 MAG: hypothetical protein A2497_07595 [Candidatus Firestonebacteria bacterium RifOxyC12_full_39_7]OGF57100.1 MAG: hypothetical protein A2452_03665 [Candidatus Firestonebacteria bacterium RIFOXYC2_FULL_39_67]